MTGRGPRAVATLLVLAIGSGCVTEHIRETVDVTAGEVRLAAPELEARREAKVLDKLGVPHALKLSDEAAWLNGPTRSQIVPLALWLDRCPVWKPDLSCPDDSSLLRVGHWRDQKKLDTASLGVAVGLIVVGGLVGGYAVCKVHCSPAASTAVDWIGGTVLFTALVAVPVFLLWAVTTVNRTD